MCVVYCKNCEDPKFRHLGNYTSTTTRSSNPCLATTCLIECGNGRRMPDQRYNSWGKCHLLGYVFLAPYGFTIRLDTHTLVLVGGCIYKDQSYYYYSSKMKKKSFAIPCPPLFCMYVVVSTFDCQ